MVWRRRHRPSQKQEARRASTQHTVYLRLLSAIESGIIRAIRLVIYPESTHGNKKLPSRTHFHCRIPHRSRLNRLRSTNRHAGPIHTDKRPAGGLASDRSDNASASDVHAGHWGFLHGSTRRQLAAASREHNEPALLGFGQRRVPVG